jgi:hypothetical protein
MSDEEVEENAKPAEKKKRGRKEYVKPTLHELFPLQFEKDIKREPSHRKLTEDEQIITEKLIKKYSDNV